MVFKKKQHVFIIIIIIIIIISSLSSFYLNNLNLTNLYNPHVATLNGAGCTTYNNYYNRIYNKIVDRDWFSARLFVT